MSLADFGKPYKDTYGAHLFSCLEYLTLLITILWVQTGVAPGTSEYTIVDFTFKLGIIALLFKLLDMAIFIVSPKKADTSIISTLGPGDGWRMFWGTILGILSIGVLSGGSSLSFFSTFLQFNTSYMFLFLVIIGPRIEEAFSNVLMPVATYVIKYALDRRGVNTSWIIPFTLALLFVVAPLFAVFHYFTYFEKSGADTGQLIFLLSAAYIYRCIFTIGNYVLKTDEYSKMAHSVHNLIGYILVYGNPMKLLTGWEILALGMLLLGLSVYFTSLLVVRLGKDGLKGLPPDTILSSMD